MLDDKEASEKAVAALTQIVTFRMARTQNKLNTQMTHLLRQGSDLSLVEWRIMRLLSVNGPSTMAHLLRQAQMDKGQASRKAKDLIERGMILSAADEHDSRKQILRVSPTGLEVLDRMMPMIERRLDALVGDVPAEHLAIFYEVLARIDRGADWRDA